MDFQHKFIFISLAVLSPIFVIYLHKGLFLLGKFIWKFLVEKFPKLQYQLIQLNRQENEDIIYVLTSTLVLYFFFLFIWILI